MKRQNLIRKRALSNYGFGIDIMKSLTVCKNCNSLERSGKIMCSKCGERLPKTNLYTLYKSKHASCKKCGTVISDDMQYCPHCGVAL